MRTVRVFAGVLLLLVDGAFTNDAAVLTPSPAASDPDVFTASPTTSDPGVITASPTTSDPDVTTASPTTSDPDASTASPTTSDPDASTASPTASIPEELTDAPMFLLPGQETCSNGIEGIDANGVVCCPLSCGECAGEGCSLRPGGISDCCGGTIKDSGVYCGESGEAPCIIGDAPADTCSNGIEGIDANGVVCCPLSCGECAGEGCALRPGGSSDCCGSAIQDSGVYCGDSGAAPCIIGDAPDTCSNGIEGIDANGVVCCPLSCGECAGEGCALRPGGSSDCCGGTIKESGVYCGDSGVAPCIIGDAPEPCPNGIEGIDANGIVCCPLSCGECAGEGCALRPGGLSDCCGGTIKESGVFCEDSGEAPCII
eukprot:g1665.t1